MHLIVQYYEDGDSQRREELHFCMRKNLEHPCVESVHDLQNIAMPPEDILQHPKYRQVSPSDWLTYRRAFDYANASLPDKVVALINLDVFLDDGFQPDAFAQYPPHVVLALARWEYDPGRDGPYLSPNDRKQSMSQTQDAWVFRTPLNVENCDFRLGTLTCDNAIAHRLHSSGYLPVNDCLRFRILHYDICRWKPGQNKVQYHKQRAEIQTYPYEEGQMLLPWRSDELRLDQVADGLELSDLERYNWACRMFNSKRKLQFTKSRREN